MFSDASDASDASNFQGLKTCLAAWQYLRQGKGRRRQQLVLPRFRLPGLPWVQWVYHSLPDQVPFDPFASEQPLPNTATKQCLCITRLPTRSHSIHRRFSRFRSRYSDCTNFTRIVPRRWTRENDGVLHMIDQDLYLYIYIIIIIYVYNYIILYICTGIYVLVYIATHSTMCLLPWNSLRGSGEGSDVVQERHAFCHCYELQRINGIDLSLAECMYVWECTVVYVQVQYLAISCNCLQWLAHLGSPLKRDPLTHLHSPRFAWALIWPKVGRTIRTLILTGLFGGAQYSTPCARNQERPLH